MERDIIISVGASDKHSSKVFKCETLKFTGKATFAGCSFPNLHFIEFNCFSNEAYLPFEDCEFGHPVNLHFDQKINCRLPFNLSVQSIRALEESTVFAEEHEWEGPLNYIKLHDKTVKAKYGEDPEIYLEEYRELFSCDSVKFATEAPKILMEPIPLSVTSGLRGTGHPEFLGQIRFEIDDDPFSLAVLSSEGPILNYSGDIPLNWGDKIHPLVREKISKIRELTIQGDLQTGAFTRLDLSLRLLSVSGTVHAEAFNQTQGKILQFIVTGLEDEALVGSKVDLSVVRVDELGWNADLEAETVSLLNASDLPGVKHAKTLIIRKGFNQPVDLRNLEVTKIDFTEVESEGPFILLNFDDQEKVVLLDRQVIYQTTRKVLKGVSGQEIHSQVIKEMKKRYTDTEFTLYSNGEEVLFPQDIEDGELTVMIKKKKVGHFLVAIEGYTELVAWGVAAILTFFASHVIATKF